MAKARETMNTVTVLQALLWAQAWNNSDLRSIDEITPNEHMLKTRRKVLREAIKAERARRWRQHGLR